MVKSIRKKLGRLYSGLDRWISGYVLGDEVSRAAIRWFRDDGDTTLRLKYPLTTDSVVFDCGGYEGDWAAAIYDRYACTVHCFEPVQSFYESICQRFSGIDAIKIYNFGLHSRNETSTIRLSGNASSTFGSLGNAQKIELIDVSNFLQSLPTDQIDLMKINIEGGEYQLLERLLETGLINRVRNLQVQFHNFVPDAEAWRERIRTRLFETHRLTYDYKFIWENWERIS